MRLLLTVLPSKFVYGDRLTSSARRLMGRLGIGFLGVVAAGTAFGMLDGDNWPDVLSGALFAWATSAVAWAVNSYRTTTDELGRELRRMAEQDLLHARLNHVAAKLGLPSVDLQAEIESILVAREERLAHFAGIDEFRPTGHQADASWWDPIALGVKSNAGTCVRPQAAK